MKKMILASASPRRREILSGLGVSFTILTADADETCTMTDPLAYVCELARRKGQAAREKLLLASQEGIEDPETVILSADTVVAAGGEILGKPKDREDAIRMIRLLSGSQHEVITGIGVTVDGVTHTSACRTVVRVARIPEEEILAYVDSGDPMDKAGSYGIQGTFSRWIEGIDGCYFNVVGLPVHALNRLVYEVTGEYLK